MEMPCRSVVGGVEWTEWWCVVCVCGRRGRGRWVGRLNVGRWMDGVLRAWMVVVVWCGVRGGQYDLHY